MILRNLGILAVAALFFGFAAGARATVFYDLVLDPSDLSGGVITDANQTVTLNLFARVVGTTPDSGAEGFLEGYGSIVSSSTGSGSIAGGLSAVLEAPFNDPGSRTGKAQNLNPTPDSVTDLGSNLTVASDDFIFARAGHLQPYQGNGVGTPLTDGSDGTKFLLAKVTFTFTGSVDALMGGDTVTLSFQVPTFSSRLNYEAIWMEDGLFKTYNTGSSNAAPQTGLSITLMTVPEPSSALLLAFGVLAAGGVRRRRWL